MTGDTREHQGFHAVPQPVVCFQSVLSIGGLTQRLVADRRAPLEISVSDAAQPLQLGQWEYWAMLIFDATYNKKYDAS